MSGIIQESGQFPCKDGLGFAAVDRNEALRLRVWRFVRLGMKMKALGEYLGMTESTCNRWLHEDPNVRPATVLALQGFEKFLKTIREETDLDLLALPEADQNRIRADILSFKTAQTIRAKGRRRAKPRAGKRLAKS